MLVLTTGIIEEHPCCAFCRTSSGAHQYGDGAHDAVEASMRRVWRLQVLVQLRKLYRNLLRAEQLLAQPAPLYTNLAARGLPLLSISCRLYHL